MSTIHRSKGRTFDNVIQLMYEGITTSEREEEECKIVYVGITRSKHNVIINFFKNWETKFHDISNRWYTYKINQSKRYVLITPDDIDHFYFYENDSNEVFEERQKRILSLEQGKKLTVHYMKVINRYVISVSDISPENINCSNIIGTLSMNFTESLKNIKEIVNLNNRTITKLYGLKFSDLVTKVSTDEQKQVSCLSGIFLSIRAGGHMCYLWHENNNIASKKKTMLKF
jgi:ATP-dependent exoDNAse (exonuclease V) beta subunit